MEKIGSKELIEYLSILHNDAKCALIYNNDYELLVSIILSAQAKDEVVNSVTPILFSKYKNIEELSNAEIEDVEQIIHQVGLSHAKAKNIINAMKKLKELGYDIIPNDFNILINLDGVGRKTANVFLSEYYNENTLGIDTHILRISKRLNLIEEKSDALKAELILRDYFKDYSLKRVHHLLIAFGRLECNAKKPLCGACKIKEKCKMGSI